MNQFMPAPQQRPKLWPEGYAERRRWPDGRNERVNEIGATLSLAARLPPVPGA
jgi:hypothetical protein